MAMVELKYNDTVIYVEDTIPEEERGYALEKKEIDNLNYTQEFKPINNKDDLLEKTMEFEIIGDKNE